MNYKQILLILCVYMGVTCVAGCFEKHENRDSNDTIILPEIKFTYREISYTQKFKKGNLQHLESNPQIFILVQDIESESNRCTLKINNAETDVMRQGQIVVGEYASFAPDLVGTIGLQLEAVGQDEAVFRIRYSMETPATQPGRVGP
jgi:hypothetical protein